MPDRNATHVTFLDAAAATLEDYRASGGGRALAAARARGGDAVVDELVRSGLRGRGGAGFPTGVKWRAVRDSPAGTKYVVCNAAEGEPGTFKDRWLLRRNPYQVLEGLAIAADAIGASRAYVAVKATFVRELARLGRAAAEMRSDGLLGETPIEVVAGPDDYLFGEEKAMLEVIEGRLPLPRILPPYQVGLFAAAMAPNPTVVNNVETLAHVVPIIRDGAERFRSVGTDGSPGTMLFTLSGDVQRPGVYEVALGTPLGTLIHDFAGGPSPGRRIKAVFPGASNAVMTADQLDTALDFDAMQAAGSGLGSGGFVVYDDSACVVGATAAFSRFLFVESCGQCPACKEGARKITACLERIERGTGAEADLDTVVERCRSVTGGSRCGLPDGESLLVRSAVERFREEFVAHLGRGCPQPRRLPFPDLKDFDEQAGQFVLAGPHAYDVEPVGG
ncbi:MAG: SLBB domain-containing protein [Actinobacteria bacterium]|nr:SLBB domain-containing protein [Actinomycetota bacterium]